MAVDAGAAIHTLRNKGLAAVSTRPSSDFPSGPPGQEKVPSTSKLHSQSPVPHVNPLWKHPHRQRCVLPDFDIS